MELRPLTGCVLDYPVTVLFPLNYFISSGIIVDASRAEIISVCCLTSVSSSVLGTVDGQKSTTFVSLHRWTLGGSVDVCFHGEGPQG